MARETRARKERRKKLRRGLREKSHNVLSSLVWDRAVPDSPHFIRSQGLGHPGRRPHPKNHRALHRSGKRDPRPPPWHHLPWEVLKADPAHSSPWGFFPYRTKEEVKTCGTCGHRFGTELLLPKGEPGKGSATEQPDEKQGVKWEVWG